MEFLPQLPYEGKAKQYKSKLSISEVMIIVIAFHGSGFRTFKDFYGWYFGFKLPLIINDRGEILSFALTPENTDDRKPVPDMAKSLVGKLFAG